MLTLLAIKFCLKNIDKNTLYSYKKKENIYRGLQYPKVKLSVIFLPYFKIHYPENALLCHIFFYKFAELIKRIKYASKVSTVLWEFTIPCLNG